MIEHGSGGRGGGCDGGGSVGGSGCSGGVSQNYSQDSPCHTMPIINPKNYREFGYTPLFSANQ